ncbi:MAG TPA: hypothetical protein ENJ87_00730 [Gammaproteobacteria bacterium]|nr:hypothetical protein [Gammaproteobacteria bacterium]
MYEAFYGFKEKPFSMLPDPGFLYLSKKHQAALTLLEYGLLNHVGFCVISGEAGAGKTTILRALLERVADDVTVGLITNTHQSFGGLLDWVLSAFDLHKPNLSHVEMHQVFMEYLIEEYANNRTVLLIVDEAQNMKADALEELRMLSNVNSEKDQLMQVVLAGQPALKETLRKPDLMQFAQRIAVDYHLEALNVIETCGYIQHRLMTAGAEHDVFTPAACERIHCYSGGTPRLINLLCETVLVYGFADQREMIDVDLVDEMVQERMKDSVVPIVNRDAAKNDNKEAAKALEKDFPWIKTDGDDQTQIPVTDMEAEGVQKTESIADKEGLSTEEGKEKTEKVPVEPEAEAASKTEVKADGNTGKAVVAGAGGAASKPVPASMATEEAAIRKPFVKYGVLAVILVLALVGTALFFSNADVPSKIIEKNGSTDRAVSEKIVNKKTLSKKAASEKADREAALEQQKKREQEEARVKRLQVEAEALKKERDAAIAKAEEEKQAKQRAEKKAAEAAALAAKKAEKERIAEKKKNARLAKKRAAKIRAEEERVRREREKLAEERRLMDARLKEENRLKQEAEARKLEREWREEERRKEQQAARARAEQQAIVEAQAQAKAREPKNRSSECSGPTARFKANCR